MDKEKLITDSIIVFILAFISRIIFTAIIASNNPVYFSGPDTITYYDLACNLLKKGNFIVDKINNPGIFRTPGYPLFLASIYSSFGINNLPVVLFQVFLSSIACVLLYYILRRLFTRWVALAGIVLYALDTPSIYYSNKVLSETLFTCIFIVFMLTLTLFFEKKKAGYIIVSGLLLGIITLIRPVTYYLAFFLIFLFIIYFPKQIKRGISYFIVFTLIYSSVVAPWVIRNYAVAGYLGISAVKELNLCNFKGAWVEMTRRNEHDIYKIQNELAIKMEKELRARNMEDNALNRALVRGDIGKEILMSNIPLLINYQIRFTLDVLFSTGADLVGEVFLNTSSQNFKDQSWFASANLNYLIYLVMLYTVTLIGFFVSMKKERIYIFLPWLITFLYMLAIHGEFDGRARFRVPLMPLIIVFFCLGITEINKRIKLYKINSLKV